MRLDITCSTDDNYAQHCMVMLCSLFENNREHEVYVHLIVDEKLTETYKTAITALAERYGNHCVFYNVSPEKFDTVRYREGKPLPVTCYYRLLAASLLPKDITKVLYLDCDVVVLGDLEEIFDIDYTGFGLAAIRDASPFTSLHRSEMGLSLEDRAFCSGVMMLNLDYWRQNDCERKLFEYASKERKVVYLEDQDALNFVFRRHWFALPYKWGKTPFSIAPLDQDLAAFDEDEYTTDVRIIHYASPLKPWLDVWFPDRKYYIKYLKKLNLAHPKFQHVTSSVRIKTKIACVRYFINKYIHPLIPDFIEIPIKDVARYIRLIISVGNSTKLKLTLLYLWINKYKR